MVIGCMVIGDRIIVDMVIRYIVIECMVIGDMVIVYMAIRYMVIGSMVIAGTIGCSNHTQRLSAVWDLLGNCTFGSLPFLDQQTAKTAKGIWTLLGRVLLQNFYGKPPNINII